MKRILFASGVHRTPHPKKNWTAEDVDAVFAATMASSLDRIPLVIGHPHNDLPVVGYLAKAALSVQGEGDRRVILFEDEGAEFARDVIDWARAEGKNKLSVKVAMPGMHLKHVGLVTEAAVDEMNAATFAEGQYPDESFAIFEADADALFGTNEYRVPWIGGLFRNIREFFIEKFGKDQADQVIPSYEIGWLMDSPSTDSDGPKIDPTFSTTTTDEPMTDAEKQEMQQLRDKVAAFESKEAVLAGATRQAAIDAVFSSEENKGKITEKNRESLTRVAENLWPKDATFSADSDPLKPLKDLLQTMVVLQPDDGHAATFAAASGEDKGAQGSKKLRKEISAVTGD